MHLEVQGAYNLFQVNEGEEHKLAFQTMYGLFQPTVMQFGTTNAPAEFHGSIHNMTKEALDDFASANFNDILIYTNSEEEHEQHFRYLMEHLLDAGLYLKPEKWEFHQENMRYLGLVISTNGISMDEDKINTVRNWSEEKMTKSDRLNKLFEVQQFLGFCNYYRRLCPSILKQSNH
jgi:hypothetical protein